MKSRSYGVTVSTLDSESSDPSSNLGRTSSFFSPEKLNLENVRDEFSQLRDVQLKAVQVSLPEAEQEELNCLTAEIQALLTSATSLCSQKLENLRLLSIKSTNNNNFQRTSQKASRTMASGQRARHLDVPG